MKTKHADGSHYLPGKVETGLHQWRAHFSCVPAAIEGAHLPIEVDYDAKLQSGQDLGDEYGDELPWDDFWQFEQKVLDWNCGFAHQQYGWLVSIQQVKKPDLEVLAWYTWFAVVGRTAKFSKTSV